VPPVAPRQPPTREFAPANTRRLAAGTAADRSFCSGLPGAQSGSKPAHRCPGDEAGADAIAEPARLVSSLSDRARARPRAVKSAGQRRRLASGSVAQQVMATPAKVSRALHRVAPKPPQLGLEDLIIPAAGIARTAATPRSRRPSIEARRSLGAPSVRQRRCAAWRVARRPGRRPDPMRSRGE
jgi:hypothetical protein